MKNWYLVLISLIGLHGICVSDEEKALQAQVDIEIGPDDDDVYYYDDDEGPVIWVGPGLYYGVWFDNEYAYHNWYRDRYYRRYGRDYDHRRYDHGHYDHGHGRHDGGHGHSGGGGGHHH